MSKTTVFLDLDRTLLDTSKFDALRWPLLDSLYPEIHAQTEHKNQDGFYVHFGDLYAYDFTKHMESLGLPVNEVYEAIRGSNLADGRLEYDGVREFIERLKERFELTILTFGLEDYQRLKVDVCPSLEGIEVITTLEQKAKLLADAGDVWLVDDKSIGDELTENVKFIQIDHTKKVAKSEKAWPVTHSMGETLDVLLS